MEFSGNANTSKVKLNYKQVNEQSGLIAGDGGYHINAENVDLNGGKIASTNAKNSELITNKITFSDIQNQSESGAVSASLSLPMKNGNNDIFVTRAILTERNKTANLLSPRSAFYLRI